MMAIDHTQIRADFPILSNMEQDKPFIYLDSASTSLKPQSVIDAITDYYSSYSANVHRGVYDIGERATVAYEGVRNKVADFIRATDKNSIIFTRSTTESINLVAYAWARQNLKPDDEILVTEMEHHSNLVPWQLACKDTGATLKYIPITKSGVLDLQFPEKYFTQNTRIFAVTHMSNVFGTINPIKKLVEHAKKVNAVTIIDGAQAVPHIPLDVTSLDCDFYAFSGHKMLGPTGVGVLYGKMEILENMEPFLSGGEMIRYVDIDSATWNDIPWKYEAGTPNIAQVIGLGAAIDYLNQIGIEKIHNYEQKLKFEALEVFRNIHGLKIFGEAPERGAVICFNIEGVHPHDLAQIIDQYGIAIRAGHHCAQPIMKILGVTSTARASFYLYNTLDEIYKLVDGLRKAVKFLK